MSVSIRSSYKSFIFLFFVFIFPFIFFQKVFNPYEFPKFIGLVSFSFVVGNILLLFSLFQKKFSLKLSSLDFAVVFFILTLFVADLFGVSIINSFLGSSYRLQGFITYLALVYLYFITRYLSSRFNKDIFAQTLGIQLLMLGVLLCSQFVLKNLSFDVSLFQNRLHGTFGNPNFAGGYLAMLFAYVLFWSRSHSFIYKIKPVILLFGGIGIVLTDSRSAILAVVIVVIIYFLTLAFWIGKYRLFISSLLLLSIVSSLFLILNYSLHARRISEWENRSIIWTEGIRLIEIRPILGYGQETVGIIFPEHLHFAVDNMHNIFLEYAISAGVVGSIAFLVLLFFGLRSLNGSGKLLVIAFLITGSLNPLSISQLVLLWVVIGIGKNSL